jgi:IRSp53/MIM homology domain
MNIAKNYRRNVFSLPHLQGFIRFSIFVFVSFSLQTHDIKHNDSNRFAYEQSIFIQRWNEFPLLFQNILEKFNPGAKHLIGSSKSYLKSLHNTSAASKVFIESLAKLAVNAHEGGTSDIGTNLKSPHLHLKFFGFLVSLKLEK